MLKPLQHPRRYGAPCSCAGRSTDDKALLLGHRHIANTRAQDKLTGTRTHPAIPRGQAALTAPLSYSAASRNRSSIDVSASQLFNSGSTFSANRVMFFIASVCGIPPK